MKGSEFVRKLQEFKSQGLDFDSAFLKLAILDNKHETKDSLNPAKIP